MAVLTLFGLLSALLGDRPGQVLSWVALAVPLLVLAWYLVEEKLRKGRAYLSRSFPPAGLHFPTVR